MNQNNSKRNSVILLVILLVVAGFLFFNKKTEAPVTTETPSSKMPPIDNKDQMQVTGKASINDLIGFSIFPGTKVSGIKSYRGTIKGGYFFEANIRINILDANKNVIKEGHATATSDWMTADPVEFEGSIDFTNLAKGPAFIEIHNDNASDLPENDKSILIPIVIE